MNLKQNRITFATDVYVLPSWAKKAFIDQRYLQKHYADYEFVLRLTLLTIFMLWLPEPYLIWGKAFNQPVIAKRTWVCIGFNVNNEIIWIVFWTKRTSKRFVNFLYIGLFPKPSFNWPLISIYELMSFIESIPRHLFHNQSCLNSLILNWKNNHYKEN